MKTRSQRNEKKSGAVPEKEKICKLAKEKNNKIVPGVRVNLIRLNKESIQQMLNGGTKSNSYNFSLKLSRDGKLACTKHPKSIVPSIRSDGNILISIRELKTAANDVNDSPTYNLRQRKAKDEVVVQRSKPIQCATVQRVSELGVSVQKNSLWATCKRQINKTELKEGAFVFAKQTGYAPWPSSIVKMKSKSSAIIKYYGCSGMTGTVLTKEIVQKDEDSLDSIAALVSYTMKTQAIKDFPLFKRGIQEIAMAYNFKCKFI